MIPRLIDTHVSFGFWPWMDFSAITPGALIRNLQAEGIQEAWISSIESLLFPDVDIPDARLREAFQNHPQVKLVKTINPILGNWRESLQTAIEVNGFHLVRIAPSYHLYPLLDWRVIELAETLLRLNIPLIVQMRIEDERNQYPLLQVTPPPPEHIAHLAALFPHLRILVLGALANHIPAILSDNNNALCDISFAESGTTVESLLATVPPNRLLFGSHSPFFYTQASVRKLTGAAICGSAQQDIAFRNARAFLPV